MGAWEVGGAADLQPALTMNFFGYINTAIFRTAFFSERNRLDDCLQLEEPLTTRCARVCHISSATVRIMIFTQQYIIPNQGSKQKKQDTWKVNPPGECKPQHHPQTCAKRVDLPSGHGGLMSGWDMLISRKDRQVHPEEINNVALLRCCARF